MTTTKEKNCDNCLHFCRHYTKHRMKYLKVFCGHCTHKHMIKTVDPWNSCKYWEDAGSKIEERKRSVREAIIAMSMRLDELTVFLSDDTDK